jgi:hypothetical protein
MTLGFIPEEQPQFVINQLAKFFAGDNSTKATPISKS